MTKLSRYLVEPKYMGWYITQFWSAITLLDNTDEVKLFLKDLLSHTETKMFAKRLQVARMLLDGYRYQDIRNTVKVTPITIAKINNLLNDRGEGFKKIITRIARIEQKIRDSKKPNLLKPRHTFGSALLTASIKIAAKETKHQLRRLGKRRSVSKSISSDPLH